jgi:uncharacterized membrane protein YhaH (DUF805 family)
LLLLVPLIALSVRRFRDAGWSPNLAIALFAVNYGGLAVGYVTATALLSDVTVGGTAAIQTTESIAAFLGLLAFALLQLACLVVLAIGGAQKSRNSKPQ